MNRCLVAMVLNALEVDPKRRWKGNWRWFSGSFFLERKGNKQTTYCPEFDDRRVLTVLLIQRRHEEERHHI